MKPLVSAARAPKALPVYVWSLGCPKNRADTEHLLGSLGIPVKTVPHMGNAKVIFINTCAFIESATRESLSAIFEAGNRISKFKRKPLLVVAGCLPGRYGKLAEQIPEVDLWLDSASIHTWPDQLLSALHYHAKPQKGRLHSTGSYMWLKIAEGCQHRCAFCTIPSIRGKLRSESMHSLSKEAEEALKKGVREIILVAQDVTAWGKDFGETASGQELPDLIHCLADLPDLDWLRLMYLHPAAITDRLLETMAEGAPILPYLDIPFQHCQATILKRMGRPFAVDPQNVIARIRDILPNSALRATLMVGFPGETDADFAALCQFVRDVRFENLGIFAFEAEEGTAAANMPDQVPVEIRHQRREQLMMIQRQISAEILSEKIGSTMDVLVDRAMESEWAGLMQGRVWFQAPEVDGVTYISGDGAEPGALINAEIVDASDYDLSALT